MIRTQPLEVEQVPTASGSITLPTPQEMLRIKAWLVVTRNATRDYVDLAALADKLGVDEATHALACMDALYPQRSGERPVQQLINQLAEPRPFDLDATDLSEYRELGDSETRTIALTAAAMPSDPQYIEADSRQQRKVARSDCARTNTAKRVGGG